MVKVLLWLVLLALCWPVALAALVLFPVIWLLLLPFRVLRMAMDGILELVRALFLLPSRALRALRV